MSYVACFSAGVLLALFVTWAIARLIFLDVERKLKASPGPGMWEASLDGESWRDMPRETALTYLHCRPKRHPFVLPRGLSLAMAAAREGAPPLHTTTGDDYGVICRCHHSQRVHNNWGCMIGLCVCAGYEADISPVHARDTMPPVPAMVPIERTTRIGTGSDLDAQTRRAAFGACSTPGCFEAVSHAGAALCGNCSAMTDDGSCA